MAIRVILACGVLAFAFLFLMAAALRHAATPDEKLRVSPRESQTAFQGDRAYADLLELASYGPRIPGSTGSAKARALIERSLRHAGLRIRRDSFEMPGPKGPHTLINLVGVVQGTQPGVILLCTHYDTIDRGPGSPPGVVSSISEVAWLLEMARALGPEREGSSLWLCFFDGGEWGPAVDQEDRHHGSAHFEAALRQTGEEAQIRLVVYVEGVGDGYLGINRDTTAPPLLWEVIRNQAMVLGYGVHIRRAGEDIPGGHKVFAAQGVPTLALCDRQRGGSLADHRRIWRTALDTVEQTSPASLQAVGDVVMQSLDDLEARVGALSH